MQERNIKYFYSVMLAVFFAVAISFPALDQYLHITQKLYPQQKKAGVAVEEVKMPSPAIANLDPYPKAFEKYYESVYTVKRPLVAMNSYLKVQWLGIAPNKNVVIGKNGWLYLGNEWVDEYRSKKVFTQQELEKLKHVLHERASWYAARGARFYVVAAPVKHRIYPEHLPPYITQANPVSRLDQVKKAFANDTLVHFIDVRDALLEEKSKHRLFYMTDNHWNDYGAYYAYKTILERIGRDFPGAKPQDLSTMKLDTTQYMETGGGESMIIQGGKEFRECFVRLHPLKPKAIQVMEKKYPVPPTFPYPGDYELTRENPSAALPNAVIIRDSFTDFMVQFMAEDFKRSVFIFDNWEYKANKDIVASESPKIVILELVEINFSKLLVDEK